MLKLCAICLAMALLPSVPCRAQEPAGGAAKPAEHIIGTVTKVDQAAHSITVKDKTGTESVVLVGNTRTLLKVPPDAKDLKSAQRITAEDFQIGDRVDVRGSKDTSNSTQPSAISARSVILMSARDLAQAHQAEAAAWQHSTAGTVSSVDAATGTLNITVRTPEGPKPATVSTNSSTEFTRYSPETPRTPAPSHLADIQPGDKVRIIGDKSEDGAAIRAHKVYSGAFRTVAGTVTSISPDGKQLTIKDLQTKQPVDVSLTADSVVRKLPPMMAMMLARRLNPDFRATQGNAGSASAAHVGEPAPPNDGHAAGPPGAAQGASGHWTPGGNNGQGDPMRAGTGDLPRIIEHSPAINISDLKPGDAVVISGTAASAGNAGLIASSIIAGVEAIFQSAPPRQGRSLGDWSLDMGVPAE